MFASDSQQLLLMLYRPTTLAPGSFTVTSRPTLRSAWRSPLLSPRSSFPPRAPTCRSAGACRPGRPEIYALRRAR